MLRCVCVCVCVCVGKKEKKGTNNYCKCTLHSLGSNAAVLSKVKTELNESLGNESDECEAQ